MNKLLIFFISLIAIAAIAIAATILHYSKVNITVSETLHVGPGGGEEYPPEEIDISSFSGFPGDSFNKSVIITNTGTTNETLHIGW